ncbi:MAG: DNA polymerase III subunit delta [Alphaproteobacteria bacterium]|nr:DNA polymerase III subunit delta [Alphaproteobacteria bacterium]
MKLSWKQIEPFVRSPDPKARVILVYGPDAGLMRERVKTMGLTIVEDLNDPFNAVTLGADILNDDPARLSDEAKAMSMMGGGRLIRIESGGDKLTALIKEYLEDPSAENLVIIEAGELGPRSSLRKACEAAKNAAALPCYVEDERSVSNLIRDMVRDAGYRIDADATHWLAANITGDRAKARGEIEKLITYIGPKPENAGSTIRLEDVQSCCGEAGAVSLDDLTYAVAGADTGKAMNSFHRLIAEGVPEIVILRTLQNHFRRLHYTHSQMSEGQSVDQAVKALQPPIFFKFENAFKGQVTKWKLPKLNLVLGKLSELEAQTKMTGSPVQTLCAQAILSISAMR